MRSQGLLAARTLLLSGIGWRGAASQLTCLRGLSSAAPDPDAAPSFAVGFSEAETLSVAVVECVEQVKAALGAGVQPHLLQLFVSTKPFRPMLHLGPAFVYECFTGPGVQPPVLLGGGVEAVLAVRPGPLSAAHSPPAAAHCGPGVSLLAARLPGVGIHAFHVEEPVAPPLGAEQWRALLGAGSPGGQPPPVAGLLLAEPHFVEVERLVSRLQGLLPTLSLLGGVLAPGPAQAGYGSLVPAHGSLFLGPESLRSGAVGCLLQAPPGAPPLLTPTAAPVCRPVGPAMRVTAARGNTVLALDGVPALEAMRRVLEQLADKQRENLYLPIQVGLDISGTGQQYVARNLGPANRAQGSIQLAVLEVPQGSLLQMQLHDTSWGAAQVQAATSALLGVGAGTSSSSEGSGAGDGASSTDSSYAHSSDDGSSSDSNGADEFSSSGSNGEGPDGPADGPQLPGSQHQDGMWHRQAAPQALLAFSCTAVDSGEPQAVITAMAQRQQQGGAFTPPQQQEQQQLEQPLDELGGVVFQGIKCSGEFALDPGGAPTMHSFTTCFGLLGAPSGPPQ